jgi:hypothetical protein
MKVIKFEKPEVKQEEFKPYCETLLYRNAYLNQKYGYGLPEDNSPITYNEFSDLLSGVSNLIPFKDILEYHEYLTHGFDTSFVFAVMTDEATMNDKKYAAAKAGQIREREKTTYNNLVYNFLQLWSNPNVKISAEDRKEELLGIIKNHPRLMCVMSELLDVICIREWYKCTESDYEDEIGKVFYKDNSLREFLELGEKV